MGSNYFGEMNIGSTGNDQRSSSSSRKSRKNNSDKPKQPQRGLGVAQLEKMRLHGQIPCNSYLSPYPSTHVFNQEDLRLQTAPSSSSSSLSSSSSNYGFQGHQSFLMGLNEFSRANNINFCDSQASTTRWTNTTSNGHFFNAQEDIQKKRKKDRNASQNCETGQGDDELDLELRL